MLMDIENDIRVRKSTNPITDMWTLKIPVTYILNFRATLPSNPLIPFPPRPVATPLSPNPCPRPPCESQALTRPQIQAPPPRPAPAYRSTPSPAARSAARPPSRRSPPPLTPFCRLLPLPLFSLRPQTSIRPQTSSVSVHAPSPLMARPPPGAYTLSARSSPPPAACSL